VRAGRKGSRSQEWLADPRRKVRGDWNYHVSPSINRGSILRYGLDITRMNDRGIAGSTSPEVEGVFIAQSLADAFWFASFRTHERVDVWSVDARGLTLLEDQQGGEFFYPGLIGPERLRLVEGDLAPDVAATRLDDGKR
jgi:hypothetical protein